MNLQNSARSENDLSKMDLRAVETTAQNPELDIPESNDVQDQILFLMSMSPLPMFMDYFDSGIRNPLKKQFATFQLYSRAMSPPKGILESLSPTFSFSNLSISI